MIAPGPLTAVVGPADDAKTILEVGLGEIVQWTLIIVVAAFVSYVVYRAMEHPRLRLVPTPTGLRTTRRDVVLYAISIPFLVSSWIVFFWAILLLVDNRLDALGLIVLPAAIVIAARVLAHLNRHVAHEVAKAVPLTIITLIILGGQIRNDESFLRILDEVEPITVSWPALLFVLLVDYALTAIWYWGYVRWWLPRRAARSAAAEHHPAPDTPDTPNTPNTPTNPAPSV